MNLFYHHANGTLRLASELKALLADPALPRRIDAGPLDCYLARGYVPDEHRIKIFVRCYKDSRE